MSKRKAMEMQELNKENGQDPPPSSPPSSPRTPPAKGLAQIPPTPCPLRTQQGNNVQCDAGKCSPADAEYIELDGRWVRWTDDLHDTPPPTEWVDIWDIRKANQFKPMCPTCNFKENGGNIFRVCK